MKEKNDDQENTGTGLMSYSAKVEECLPRSCQLSQRTARPHPEPRQDADSELHLNSSSYPRVCPSSTWTWKTKLI